jgi:pilus assembly protein CpaF
MTALALDVAHLKRSLHARLLAAVGDVGADREAIRRELAALLRDEAPLLDADTTERLLDELVGEVAGLGPLEALLADPEVTEVMLNGPGRAYVERSGRLEAVALDLDAGAIVRLAERVIAPLGLRLDRASPIVDARLPDGCRLHAVLPPLAADGPCVTIRRFAVRPAGVGEFGVGPAAAELLDTLVRARWNLLVAGATSAGKTTLVNTLVGRLGGDPRIVTIEETAELSLPHPHVVRLEARPANAEGIGAVTIRELLRAALRMRPDRIVVGEVRGGEAFDLLQALNTGHDGSMSTIHAGDARGALARLETLALLSGVALPLPAVRAQIAAAIDAVVVVSRTPGRERRLDAVVELVPGSARLALRTLLRRDGHDLVACEAPARPPREPGVEIGAAWDRC